MIDKEFNSQLTKFSSKKVDEQVINEFIISYISENESRQEFLRTWDEKFNLAMMLNFTNDEWTTIVFKTIITNLNIEFDGIKMNSDLVGIKVTRKEKMDTLVYKYDFCFHKQHQPEIDAVFATAYLKRKEMKDDGKKVLLQFKTIITK
jgi:hypothetical protein